MGISTYEVINIMRNTTGRVDANDPLFTDAIMLNYLNNFIQQEASQEVRLFQNYTWWLFSIDELSSNPYPVDLANLTLIDGSVGATTISDPAFIQAVPTFDGEACDQFFLSWYQSPEQFYAKWPETIPPYQPQRPIDVLYFNQELTFRGPPDREYNVKIQAYRMELECTLGQDIPYAFLFRYIAYGASLDIFSDYGEMDKYNDIFPVYRRYRAMVQGRTWNQFITQRTFPQF